MRVESTPSELSMEYRIFEVTPANKARLNIVKRKDNLDTCEAIIYSDLSSPL